MMGVRRTTNCNVGEVIAERMNAAVADPDPGMSQQLSYRRKVRRELLGQEVKRIAGKGE